AQILSPQPRAEAQLGGGAAFGRKFRDQRLGVVEAVFAERRLNESVDGGRSFGALGPAGGDELRQLGEFRRLVGEVRVVGVVGGGLRFDGQRLVGGERYLRRG